MSTKKSQQIGIWIIVIVFAIGAVGTFAVMILSTQNDKKEQDKLAVACKDYKAELSDQVTSLSDKYYTTMKQFSSSVDTFKKDSVTKLLTKDLKVGDGETITADSSYSAYYIGWNPSGTIFDQSIEGNSLKAPLDVVPGAGMITGWTEGVKGMKLGGVRELTIPSDQAYGEQDKSDEIPPNTPLKFIVVAIPTPEAVTIPEALKPYESYINAGYLSSVCQ